MKRTLYLGLDLPIYLKNENVVHCPLIKIIPRDPIDLFIVQAFENFNNYTHLIFTSKNAVSIFFDLAKTYHIALDKIKFKTIITVGKRTADKLGEYGALANHIAKEETAEGVVTILGNLDLNKSHVFLPQSSLSRLVISDWLQLKNVALTSCHIYDTAPNFPKELPDLVEFEQIVFTSPSVVNAFMEAYGSLPRDKTLVSIGLVTEEHLQSLGVFKTMSQCHARLPKL